MRKKKVRGAKISWTTTAGRPVKKGGGITDKGEQLVHQRRVGGFMKRPRRCNLFFPFESHHSFGVCCRGKFWCFVPDSLNDLSSAKLLT